MKALNTILFILSFVTLYAQAPLTPDFSFTLYVEDAKGNKDSIVLGYDRRVIDSSVIDSRFGEEDLSNTPYDSILEIRGAKKREPGSEICLGYKAKKVISPSKYKNICPEESISWIVLYLQAKYPPIKFSWQQSLFKQKGCPMSKTFMVLGNRFFLDDSCYFTGDLDRDSCFAEVEKRYRMKKFGLYSIAVDSAIHYNNHRKYYGSNDCIDTIQGGKRDSIYTYVFSFEKGALEVKNEDLLDETVLSVSPNPASDYLQITMANNISSPAQSAQLYDYTGKIVQNWQLSPQYDYYLPLNGVPKGFYLLQVKSDKGKIVANRKVIIQ